MPRQQVYGKRSRANLDVVAIFADGSSSPTAESQSPDRAKDDDRGREEHRKDTRFSGPGKSVTRGAGIDERRVLAEVNVNRVVTESGHTQKKAVRRRPREAQRTKPETDTATAVEADQAKKETVIVEPGVVGLERESEAATLKEPTSHAHQREQPRVRARTRREPALEKKSTSGPIYSGQQTLFSDRPQDVYAAHAASLLSLSAHEITCFSEWSTQLSSHFDLTKIAEASYGEVYRLSALPGLLLPGFTRADESVLKIMALKAPTSTLPKDKRKRAAALRKQEAMSQIDDVANEVRLLQRMSSIPGFTNFRDVRIMRGRPPPAFVTAFQAYNTSQKAQSKELSVFPDPAKKTSYAEDQLWAVIEMQDAGTDLERCVDAGQVTSISAIWDVFWQVVLTLGKGEEAAEFEHRDLHLGNICIRARSALSHDGGGDEGRNLHFSGLETTVIDYTLSRAALHEPSAAAEAVAFHDLALPANAALFEADATHEYQYEIYRLMRALVVPRSWSAFHPRTNLLWLHFLLQKLLAQPARLKPTSRRERRLETRLSGVQALLRPEGGCGTSEEEKEEQEELVDALAGLGIDVEGQRADAEKDEETGRRRRKGGGSRKTRGKK
nr:putative serine/threonine-protein kinase haspin like [Quercus suber]